MTKRRAQQPDPRQLGLSGIAASFFEPAAPADLTAGSLDIDSKLRGWLAQALKDSPLDRDQVAAEMTRYLGLGDEERITKAQVDAWTAMSKTAWRFPASYMLAFVATTNAHWLLDKMASLVGCRVLVGEEALIAQSLAAHAEARRALKRAAEIDRHLPQRITAAIVKKGRA